MNWLKAHYIELLLALLLFGLLYLSIPLTFSPYIVEKVITQSENSFAEHVEFADITGDGSDEVIFSGGKEHQGDIHRHGCAIKSSTVFFKNIRSIEQLNVPERLFSSNQFFTADFNHNGRQEVYLGGVIKDSVFLYCFEYPNLKEPFLIVPIDSIVRYEGVANLSLSIRHQLDINDNGTDEIFFSLRNSYPIYPRKIYRLDVLNEELIASPSVAFNISANSTTKETNNNYFTGSGSGSGNFKPWMDIPYSDYGAYLYVLNQDLQFVVPPRLMARYPNGVTSTFAYGSLYCFIDDYISDKTTLYKSTLEGKFIDSTTFESIVKPLKFTKDTLLVASSTELFFVKEDLSSDIIIEFEHPLVFNTDCYIDIDGDTKPELIAYNQLHGKMIIISSDFRHVVSNDINFYPSSSLTFKTKNQKNYFGYYINQDHHYYQYLSNPFYPWKYPYLLLLAGLSLLVSFKSFSLYRKNIDKAHRQELEMNRYQMLAIKNQVDPHFTLNALNSIDYMYQNDEKKRANKFMVKLSRLMHQTLMNSDKMTSTLYEELDFIRTYCQLEEVRSSSQFSFEIIVAEEIDPLTIEIPKQLLFTYVENAIKHGIRPKKDGGYLCIHVSENISTITVRIQDNGIGFEESKKRKTSTTGKGLKILKDIIALYKSMKGKNIEIENISNSNGTVINIFISKNYSHKKN